MKREFLDTLPDWYKDDTEHDLVLSDDLDGLVSTSVLHHVHPKWNIEYFYDFEKLFISGEVKDKKNKADTRVWSDVAILKNEMCFDNHVSRKFIDDYRNNNCINPNLMTNISNSNYYDKYCGSTALLVWSIYDLPLPKTEEGKMLLLAIDSTFKGFYTNGNFKNRNKFYLCDVLGMEELYEVEKRHEKKEFYDLIEKYQLSTKTEVVDEKLNTELDLNVIGELLGIDIILPEKTFDEYKSFNKLQGSSYKINSVKDIKRVVTLAFTGKDYVMCSTLAS